MGLKRSKAKSSLYEWMEAAIFSLICIALIFTLGFRIVGVDGTSMVSTLMHGDRLMMISRFYQLDRGDIVVVYRNGDEPLIKRVIGISGDTVDIHNGKVYLNGAELDEPYALGETSPRDMEGPVTVPEGKLFVLGDNRTVSLDSRSGSIGLVNVSDVIGEANFRLFPFSSAGALYE